MAFSKQLTTSLLTEHFTYTPLTLIDDIIDTVNALVYTNISGIETALLSVSPVTLGFEKRAAAAATTADPGVAARAPETDENGNPLYPEASQEIEEGVQKLETLLEATVDKNFDKLEIAALRTILNVPDGLEGWVRLAHYEGLEFAHRPDAPTPESIHLLRRKVQETRKLQALLVAERSRNAALIEQLRTIIPSAAPAKASPAARKPKLEHNELDSHDSIARPSKLSLGFLSATDGARALGISLDGGVTKGQHPLTTNTKSALSHLPALRQLVTWLRPYIGSLPPTTLDGGEAGRKREERTVYIDGRVKRVLERRGLLGEDDAEDENLGVGNGALGRRVGREEVRSLERIVDGFGVKGFGRRSEEDEMEE